MKRFLSHPTTNAVGISVFTTFYAFIFIMTSGNVQFERLLYYNSTEPNSHSFWEHWMTFLAYGYQAYIAIALTAITVLIVILLVIRRRPYDEYHTAILTHCLVVASILTLIAIAVFYLIILSDASGIVEKFTLFIAIHWVTVVLADLSYVLLCRWR